MNSQNRITSVAYNPQHSVLVITFTAGADLGADLAVALSNTGLIVGFPDLTSSTLYIRGDFDEMGARRLYDLVVRYIRDNQADEFDLSNVPKLEVIPAR